MIAHPTRHTRIAPMFIGLLCLLTITSGLKAEAAPATLFVTDQAQSLAEAALSTGGPPPAPGRPAEVVDATAPGPDADEAARQQAREALAQLPHYFIANQGQIDAQVAFYARSQGHTIYFTPAEVVFALPQNILRLQFVGANPQVQVQGAQPTPAQVNFFIGNDLAQWRTGIPTYHEVVYHDLYPGIDAHFAGQQQGELKYTFVVQPGAAAEQIRLAYAGATGLRLDTNGDLIIETGSDSLKDTRPYVYQDIGGQRREVRAAFALRDDRSYGFTITGGYDRNHPLVIDPDLAYSTYLGGSDGNGGYGIAVDAAGCAYVTGWTSSTDFPTANAYDSNHNGDTDVFMTKIDTTKSGTACLLYSTYLGGTDDDVGESIDVDGSGYVYVTGYTGSTDFPTKNAYDTTYNGGYDDVFIAKLDMTQSGTASLLYSTYLGGSSYDKGCGIAATSAGCAYVTGDTESNDFPTTPNAYDATFNGGYDVFVAKLDTPQSGEPSLLYCTYLGGSGYDRGYGIALTSSCAYATGGTYSTDFPTTLNAYDSSHNGGDDVFVAKLDTTQSITASLLYSTYLGGDGEDEGRGIAVDAAGYAYVTGETWSTDFPTKNAYDSSQSPSDAFVTKLDTTQSGTACLLYSTLLGGSGWDGGNGIDVDSAGCAYVTGTTESGDFPTKNAYDSVYNYNGDAFVTKLDTTQSGTASLFYSTFLGGSYSDYGDDIALTSSCAYVTGGTSSTDFPTWNAYDPSHNGDYNDAFVTKLDRFNYYYLPAVLKTY